MSTMEKIKCDCGERYYNAQESFDDHWFSNLCHMVIKDEKDIQKIVDAVEKVVKELKDAKD